MVVSLSQDGVEEVNSSERASHERERMLPTKIDASLCTNMGEDVVVPKLAQYKLSVVSVSSEVFKTVQSLAETAKRF
jgi:hypothetical protein